MPQVFYGRKDEPPFQLQESKDLIAVRTRSGQSVTRSGGPVPRALSAHLQGCTLVQQFPEAGVEIYRTPPARRGGPTLAIRKAALRAEPDVRFAGGVLVDPASGSPVLYTENLFVKFIDSADAQACRDVLLAEGLAIRQEPGYAVNAFVLAAPEGTGQAVFDIAQRLLQRPDVEYAHPELVRERQTKAIHPAQWHLQPAVLGGVAVDAHAHVAAAQAFTCGEGITIAVIDDGFDIEHPEFGTPGKLVAPRDVFSASADPRPRRSGENHGTACAGVACAAGLSTSGVAPAARLMPIRHVAALGSQAEAEAFRWAADQGADVISCSWGPPDGTWWDPDDPLHHEVVPMPPSTRLAIGYAASAGRGGKGCVIFFAAGNGNESVDNDGYATHPEVLAVAACNDRSRRSVYSDFGRAVWCAFPSGDDAWPEQGHPAPLTPGIWTTDRRGRAGYNAGNAGSGDAEGLYAGDFSGTSSACPGAAGVAALVLAVNPALTRVQVADILKRACDRIDPAAGAYDAQGHSALYGHGRLNALTAVTLAQPQPRNEVTVSRRFDAPLPDLRTVRFTLDITEATAPSALSVAVDLLHSYIGDLVITLHPPAALRVAAIVLHDRGGGTRNSLKKVYDAGSTPALTRLAGRVCRGRWTLSVRDAAAQDTGTLVSWSLRLVLPPPGAPAAPPVARKAGAAGRRPPVKKTAARRAAVKRTVTISP